jgi:hypothetical protein
MLRLSIVILVLLLIASTTLAPAWSQQSSRTEANKTAKVAYILTYQRWGDFGSYHLGMKLTMLTNDKASATWYINGGWDTTYAHDTLLVYQIPALFPVFLQAYIHPKHPTSPLFNIRSWDDFGKPQELSRESAFKLITMAQNGMTNINNGRFMYSPIVRPFKIGSLGFWTSNSYVASLIHWVNENSMELSLPEGKTYPGIDGPFLPLSTFEEKQNEHPTN